MKYGWKRLLAAALGCTLLLSACGAEPGQGGQAEEPQEQASQGKETQEGLQPQETAAGGTGTADEAGTAAGVNRVAGLLYDSMKGEGNTFLSPVSIYLAYGMLYQGAQGESAQQLSDFFGYSEQLADHNANCAWLMDTVSSDSLKLADSIWIDEAFQALIRQEFIQSNQEFFDAQTQTADLSSQEAVDAINAWVSENTDGMIESIMDQPDPALTLMLINCMVFQGEWEESFPAEATAEGVFHSPGGDVQRQLMQRRGTMDYYEDEVLQMVRLPYGDGKTSMVVILPREGLETVEPFADGAFGELMGKLAETENVSLTLPRMNLSYSDGGALMEALKAGGVTDVFDAASADLSGIADPSELPLCVGSTVHKTALEVDEEGTKAAAATSIGIARMSLTEEPDPTMVVDRPFYCAVVDDETGILLFCGSIVDPGE